MSNVRRDPMTTRTGRRLVAAGCLALLAGVAACGGTKVDTAGGPTTSAEKIATTSTGGGPGNLAGFDAGGAVGNDAPTSSTEAPTTTAPPTTVVVTQAPILTAPPTTSRTVVTQAPVYTPPPTVGGGGGGGKPAPSPISTGDLNAQEQQAYAAIPGAPPLESGLESGARSGGCSAPTPSFAKAPAFSSLGAGYSTGGTIADAAAGAWATVMSQGSGWTYVGVAVPAANCVVIWAGK